MFIVPALDVVLQMPILTADSTYLEAEPDGTDTETDQSRRGRRPMAQTDHEHTGGTESTESTESTNGNGQGIGPHILALLVALGERLGLLERTIAEDHAPRLGALERGQAGIESLLSEHNARMTQKVGGLETLITRSLKDNELLRALNKSMDTHRKEHADAQDTMMDAMAIDIADLKRINQERVRAEQEAKALAAARHGETLRELKTIKSSFAPALTLFPGLTLIILQGGFHASGQAIASAIALTAALIGWRLVPALYRYTRLKRGLK